MLLFFVYVNYFMENLGLISPTGPIPPVELIGRDEMNLAEFPLTLLTDRVPEGQNTLHYEDRHGKLTITGSDAYGLPTAADADVIVALIQLTKKKNNFSDPTVNFTRYELIKILNWQDIGKSYHRLSESLNRWAAVSLRYQGTWWDNDKRRKVSVTMHILDTVIIYDRAEGTNQASLPLSSFSWNKTFLESCQAGNLKSLNLVVYFSLKHPSSKRLYRFLDKRFNGKPNRPEHVFPLDELAITRVGLSPNYLKNVAKLKEKLRPAIDELERIGFLSPMPPAGRYRKEDGRWMVHLARSAAPSTRLGVEEYKPEPTSPPPLVAELVGRGMTAKTAAELVAGHAIDQIERKVEVFDWVMTQPRPPKNPIGYLVKSIVDDYAPPKGFVSKADRERQAEARRQSAARAAEERRRKRAEDAEEKAEMERVAEYWASLTAEGRAEVDAASMAEADPASMAAEAGPFKGTMQRIRREQHIRRMLADRGRSEDA
jgi:hypothetical protein